MDLKTFDTLTQEDFTGVIRDDIRRTIEQRDILLRGLKEIAFEIMPQKPDKKKIVGMMEGVFGEMGGEI